MRALSPAWRTDLLFTRFDGVVEDAGDHLVVRSPDNPFYYWGNFVLLDAVPADEAGLDRALAIFRDAFAAQGDVRHVALGWDGLAADWGAAEALLVEGSDWQREDGVVLTCEAAQPAPHDTPDLAVRPLAGDGDWAASDALNRLASPGPRGTARHDEFLRRLRRRYRQMVDAGLGTWLGAFDEGRLVAHLGLFRDGELARFQSVETHPEHRGRGACGALVAAAQRVGLEEWGVERLVIVAEPGTQAERIYRRAGMTELGRQCGLFRRPAADAG